MKVIDDRDGHEAGDKLICKAAQIICEVCPENAYRIGGDEFVVIEPEQRQEEFKRKVTACKKGKTRENKRFDWFCMGRALPGYKSSFERGG